jgi:hypothetical protein
MLRFAKFLASLRMLGSSFFWLPLFLLDRTLLRWWSRQKNPLLHDEPLVLPLTVPASRQFGEEVILVPVIRLASSAQ